MLRNRNLFLILTQLLFLVSFVSAQENYRAVHWGANEGLSFESQNMVLKDANSFIWISSPHGLNRFDGSGFKTYLTDKNKPGTLIGDFIYSLNEDSLHNIWIGTYKGLSRYDILADTISNFLPDPHAATSDIIPFSTTHDEVICIESADHITSYNIHSFKKTQWIDLSTDHSTARIWRPERGVFDEQTNSVWMFEVPDGKSPAGLLQINLKNQNKTHYSWPCFRNIPDHDHTIGDMCYDKNRHSIWLSSPDGLLEFSLNDNQFHSVDALKEIVNQKDFRDPAGISLDPRGRIWWTSYPTWIVVYNPSDKSFSRLFSDSAKQLSVAYTNYSIYCDRDNIVWTSSADQRGIYQIIPSSIPVTHYTYNKNPTKGLSGTFLNTIIEGDQKKLWIGQGDELDIFDPRTGLFQLVSSEVDLPIFHGRLIGPVKVDTVHHKALIDIFDQKNGRNELYEMDIPTRRCYPVLFKDSIGQQVILNTYDGVFPFKNGGILLSDKGIFTVDIDSPFARWSGAPVQRFGGVFGTNNRDLIFMRRLSSNLTYSLDNDKWVRIISPIDSIEWGAIYFEQADESYWVGKFGQVIHLDKNFAIIHTYTIDDGLKQEDIAGIIPDRSGNIWIQFIRDIGKIDIRTGRIFILSEKDGLQKQSYGGPSVELYGDLYIMSHGIARINPPKLTEHYPPSYVYLKSLEINQGSFPLATGLNNLKELPLKYFQNKITIGTGIIDYYSAGNSQIRYKLEGINNNWQTAPTNYIIRYDGLPPGKYWLIMQASNAVNEFNGPEKRLLINISPPFWQTTWFRILMLLTVLCLLYGIYRWRTAALRKQKRILEDTVKLRTAEVVEEKAVVERQKDVIQKEKEKSDELLLNILPSEVAEELKEKGYTTAKSFDEVTILFSDIKGFTHVAENMTAQALVKEIDTYFSAFDHIMQRYGLEKIKTIGDAYIAAGGLPEQNQATTDKVIQAAIAMQSIVEEFKKERADKNQPYFELRIGIHTGPVVAGVVGIKKFQYDVWGDTVNLAARMEQSGVPGKINISQNTYEIIKEKFTCVYRGAVEAKNKGMMDMYFVEMQDIVL
jgi:class 3 adenylate cyclase/ligand-binding sensor domain-containing protein